jgi:hypothetical protein
MDAEGSSGVLVNPNRNPVGLSEIFRVQYDLAASRPDNAIDEQCRVRTETSRQGQIVGYEEDGKIFVPIEIG